MAPGAQIGLLVLAVSAVAPLLSRKLMKIGDSAYIFSLVLTLSLMAILLVPAWLAVIGPPLDYPVSLRPDWVALVLAKSFLLPLALGMVVRRLFPAIAERAGNCLIDIAGLALTACALALLIRHWDILIVARWSGVLILAVGISGQGLMGPARSGILPRIDLLDIGCA